MPVDKFGFYKSDDDSTYRITYRINDKAFAVVKLFSNDLRTFKVWEGDYDETCSHWNTKPFRPDAELANRLRIAFIAEWKSVQTLMEYAGINLDLGVF